MKKIIITDISWDTDDDVKDLPTRIEYDIVGHPPLTIDMNELEEQLSEHITEEYGFCHNGFCWEMN
jgi:hypothetical protein